MCLSINTNSMDHSPTGLQYGKHGFSAASERRNAYVSGKNNIIFPFPETMKGKNNMNRVKE